MLFFCLLALILTSAIISYLIIRVFFLWCQYVLHASCVFLPHAVNCRRVLFLAPSVCGVFFLVCVWNILGTTERFAPNSHGRHVWSLAWTSFKVTGEGH